MRTFSEELDRYTAIAREAIEAALPPEEGEAARLAQAMNYSVRAGGKRLRPVLMLLSFEMFGGEGQDIYPFMAAMEMIHTHSLIHDDLPAMDNDMYRRGKKTTHVVYGEAAAILAGDALLNLGYETIHKANPAVRTADTSFEACRRFARAEQILSEKTGINGMIGGQSVDVEMDGRGLTKDQLSFIHRCKTGALLEACLMIGAVLAGAGEEDVSLMEQVGTKIGMAFQIRDDILDVTGDEQELGKPVMSDQRNEKTTWVTLYGLEEADETVRVLTQEAVSLLERTGRKHDFLRSLLVSLTQRSR